MRYTINVLCTWLICTVFCSILGLTIAYLVRLDWNKNITHEISIIYSQRKLGDVTTFTVECRNHKKFIYSTSHYITHMTHSSQLQPRRRRKRELTTRTPLAINHSPLQRLVFFALSTSTCYVCGAVRNAGNPLILFTGFLNQHIKLHCQKYSIKHTGNLKVFSVLHYNDMQST